MRGYVQSVSTGSSSRRLLIVIRSGGLAILGWDERVVGQGCEHEDLLWSLELLSLVNNNDSRARNLESYG